MAGGSRGLGAMPEYREELRLNPDYPFVHIGLGLAMEKKREVQGALDEFRRERELGPSYPDSRAAYERVLKKSNP